MMQSTIDNIFKRLDTIEQHKTEETIVTHTKPLRDLIGQVDSRVQNIEESDDRVSTCEHSVQKLKLELESLVSSLDHLKSANEQH